MVPQNYYHVYRRKAFDLDYVGCVCAASPEKAVETAAEQPGKFVVLTGDFDQCWQVYATMCGTLA